MGTHDQSVQPVETVGGGELEQVLGAVLKLFQSSGVNVQPTGLLIPLLLGEHHVVHPTPGTLRLECDLKDSLLHKLLQLLLKGLHEVYCNESLLRPWYFPVTFDPGGLGRVGNINDIKI